MEGFTTKEVIKLVGINGRTLDFWDHSGFIGPSLMQAKGTGSRRLYSFRDILSLRVSKEFRDRGISLQTLRKVVEHLQRHEGLETPLASMLLVTDGTDVYERHADELVSLLKEPGQRHFLFVLDLPRIVEELKEEVEKLRAA